MTSAELLQILKNDLQMMTDSNDAYLSQLLDFAKAQIEREGIVLSDTIECNMLVVQYAAYLFRKRGSGETAMPRFLRYSLNNLLLAQKGGSANDNS